MGTEIPRVKGRKCPACDASCDATTDATGDGNNRPKPGDLSVCYSCGAFLQYREDLSFQKLSLKEEFELDQDVRDQLFKISGMIKAKRNQ